MDKSNHQDKLPKWLYDLQHRSWEPEILLSGIVLYGMFQVPDLLDQFLIYFKLNIFSSFTDIDNFVGLLKMGIYWLITGLILHLICRGIWIGIVGLSYTFPKGIDYEKLRYQSKFDRKVKKIPPFETIIVNLEKLCSSLFSISFMLFMSLIGGYLIFLIFLILPFSIIYLVTGAQVIEVLNIFRYYSIAVVVLCLIVFVDFLSLGYLRRFKWFSKIYWPIYSVISRITLARYYRPIYYAMASNYQRLVLALILFTFAAVSFYGAQMLANDDTPGESFSRLTLWTDSGSYNSLSGNYDDQNEIQPSNRAHIPSDIINENVLKLFVVANVLYEDSILANFPIDSLAATHPDTSLNQLRRAAVQSFYKISIDDSVYTDLKWFFHYKSKTRQKGYLTYIDIRHLEEGLHEIKIKGPDHMFRSDFSVISFYRSIPFTQSIRYTEQSTGNSGNALQP